MPSARELARAKIDRRHLHFAQRCVSNLTFRIRLIVDHIDRNTKKIRESKDHSVKLIQFTETLYTTARQTHMFRNIGNPERFTHRTGMISQVQEELNFVLKQYDDLRETMDYLLPEEAAKSEDHRDVLDMCDWRVNRCPELTEVVPLHRVHFVSFRESAAKHRRILGHLHGELAAFRLAEFEYDRTVVCPNQDHENSPDCPDSPQYTQLALDLVCHIVHHAYCYHVKRVSELEQFYCRLRSSLTALHLEIGLKIALIQHSADSQWLQDEALAEDMRRFVPAAIAEMIKAVGGMTSHPDYLPQTMHYLVSEAKWNSVQRDVETQPSEL